MYMQYRWFNVILYTMIIQTQIMNLFVRGRKLLAYSCLRLIIQGPHFDLIGYTHGIWTLSSSLF